MDDGRRRFLEGALLGTALLPAAGIAAAPEPGYEPETDPLARRKLDQWQDWKVGFMSHWGPYSQWGVVESWSICSEDEDWCKRPDGVAYTDYVRAYEKLPETFNPVKLDPAAWARTAKDAGARYLVFTTKHHDGFAMFDTRQSDYRITAPGVPFHANPNANVTRALFDAFRAQGLGIGAYFSKPDWHSQDYWWPRFATPNRHTNYDTRKYPERWARFVDYTHRQIDELTRDYGKLDIVWLDGGWVRPRDTMDDATKGIAGVPWAQDIGMPKLAAIARRNQPGVIIVDRAVGGRYENYRTPEQEIPKAPLPYPWETCMTLGDSWSFKPDDKYKSARKVVQMLVDIVAKGGNYLLNVGAQPDGQLPVEARQRLADIGRWMATNGEAIYGTRPIAPYASGKFRFTRARNGDVNAIYLPDEGEDRLPPALAIPRVGSRPPRAVKILGNATTLAWNRTNDGVEMQIPDALRQRTAGAHAWAFRLTGAAA